MYGFIRDSPTIEHVDEDAGWFGCGWCTGVIAGIGWQRSADQKTWRSRLFLRHDANAPALAVVYHVIAFVPEKSSRIIQKTLISIEYRIKFVLKKVSAFIKLLNKIYSYKLYTRVNVGIYMRV